MSFLPKHFSFALLMAFVISWSGVAAAQQNVMHQQMMTEMTSEQHAAKDASTPKKSHSQSTPKLSKPKPSIAKASASDASMHDVATQHMAKSAHSMPDCHQQRDAKTAMPSHHMPADLKSAADQASHCDDMHLQGQTKTAKMDCHDCALWHCQLSMSFVDAALVDVQAISIADYRDTPKFIYAAQDLTGYWQEILRPPQI